ncbi:MAG: hypothetical protein MUF87_06605 [Anaerolineae bacterium]|nr:hypothetical protein [Anaerolineae bacterium]
MLQHLPKPQLIKHRDEKVKPHITQYAPVWIVEEKFIEIDDAIQFDVVFQHNLYGWVKRRYRYDGFNDTLYHKGQTQMLEEDAIAQIGDKEPYVNVTVSDIPNAYGG